ncbi:MAG: glycosyltransferase family 4 protein [Chlamydiales bacterium]|nr:glycosyltransferase family 4 protein [Chlamydiales bacterium]
MKILHTESSPGWGGQEMRILREAEGMRRRGHTVVMAIQKGGGLVEPARKAGFIVYEVPFKKSHILHILQKMRYIIKRHKIQVVNTHSSLDAWCAGLVGKVMRCHVVRTRHLSTPIKAGLNSWLLYNVLAHKVVTTCGEIVEVIEKQAHLKEGRCLSIPTGIDVSQVHVKAQEALDFRNQLGLKEEDILVGTLCVLRGWKGVSDMLHAAKILEKDERIHWVVVGSGSSEAYFKGLCAQLELEKRVHFMGHISPPFAALAAMDIFTLLSWDHEGVSQASLQAAYLKRPLVTTPTGGLKEVCFNGQTGFLVDCYAPEQVAEAVAKLAGNQSLRQTMGEAAHRLVTKNFLFEHTLDAVERAVLPHPASPQTSPNRPAAEG